MKATKFVAALAVAGLALAACGSDDDEGSDTTAGGAAPTTTAGDATTTAGGETTAGADTTAGPDTTEGADTTAGADTTEGADTTAGADTTSGGSAAAECEPAEPVEDITIGLVTDVGRVDDASFNQSAWEGAQAAAEEVGGTADFIETAAATDYATNIGQFVDSGANVIITVGFALGEATVAAAEENPDVRFIGVDQFQAETICNLTGLVFPEDQAGFLAGALAGLLTETDTIAAVLGTDQVPPVVAFKEGFEGGVAHTNSDADVIATYHPGGLDVAFTDPEFGATTARQALDNGADIVFGAGGETGNGALIEVAREGGEALCIGVDTDQWETVPEAHPCLITSAMKLINENVVELVGMIQDGSIEPGNFFGEVGLADYHDLADRVSADVQAQMDEITAGVLSGEIPTGYEP
jgi:basic membrane protein A